MGSQSRMLAPPKNKNRRDTSAVQVAEEQLLAAVLLSINAEPSRVADVVAGLTPAAFTDPIRQEVLRAVLHALKADSPGIAAVATAIRHNADSVGSDPYNVMSALEELTLMSVTSDPIGFAADAAKDIRKAHAIREAAQALEDARAALDETDDIEPVRTAAASLQAILETRDDGQARRWAGLVSMLDAWARDSREPCVPTMFGPLDRRLGGGLAIGLTGIAARPGIGKSALATQLVLGALLHDPEISAVWFRGEMTNDLLSRRLLAAWSGIRGTAVPVVTTNDSARRSKAARQAAVDLASVVGDRLKVVDPPLTPEAMENEIRRHRPRVAVVDYLQLCETSGKADRRAEVECVIRQLAKLADRYQVAFLIVSAIAGDRKKTSGIGMIAKETNLLDYSAHAMISLWADEPAEGLKRPDPYPVEMRIEKNRTGPIGQVDLFFTGSGQYFTAADCEEQLLDDGYDEFAAFSPGASG